MALAAPSDSLIYLKSGTYTLASWDHGADAAGPNVTDSILAPYAAPVPEASTWQSVGALLLLGGLLAVRRPRVKRN